MEHRWVAVDGAEVAGFMRLKPQPKEVLLDRLAVCPAFRRRGIGASLVAVAVWEGHGEARRSRNKVSVSQKTVCKT